MVYAPERLLNFYNYLYVRNLYILIIEFINMSSIKAFGIVGTGGLGVLVAGLLISKAMNFGLEWIFSAALLIFVIAGAAALVLRSAN